MPNPTAAMLVIGDEILSGRTRDANMYHLAGQLTEQGIDLKEVRVVSDDSGGDRPCDARTQRRLYPCVHQRGHWPHA